MNFYCLASTVSNTHGSYSYFSHYFKIKFYLHSNIYHTIIYKSVCMCVYMMCIYDVCVSVCSLLSSGSWVR